MGLEMMSRLFLGIQLCFNLQEDLKELLRVGTTVECQWPWKEGLPFCMVKGPLLKPKYLTRDLWGLEDAASALGKTLLHTHNQSGSTPQELAYKNILR